MDKKTEAMKLALEAFERMNHEDSIFAGEFADEITALSEALAEQPEQQQQEPVAIVEVVVPHLESIVVKHILDAPFPKVGDFFYTAPQRREWVGLTDEEVDEWTPEIHPVIRVIEAKLREKNT